MGKGDLTFGSGNSLGRLAQAQNDSHVDAQSGCQERSGRLPAGELIQYWCTVAVGEECHFTRAAQRLHLDQSAVSRHIQKLEARLGFKLFIRNGRGVELSAAGKSFLPYARRALLSADQGERLAQAIARGDPQELKVAYSPLADLHLIAQMRGLVEGGRLRVPVRFQSALPESFIRGLHEGTVHAAIGILPVEIDLDTVCIHRERLYVALPAAHRLAQSRVIPAARLGDDPVIWMFGSLDSLVSKHLIGLLQRAAYLAPIGREAQSPSEALGLVRERFGVAIVKESELRLNPDGVVLRPFTDQELVVETGLVYVPEPRWDFLEELIFLVSQYLRRGEDPVSP